MSRYFIASEENMRHLAHYGVKGMKWGKRNAPLATGGMALNLFGSRIPLNPQAEEDAEEERRYQEHLKKEGATEIKPQDMKKLGIKYDPFFEWKSHTDENGKWEGWNLRNFATGVYHIKPTKTRGYESKSSKKASNGSPKVNPSAQNARDREAALKKSTEQRIKNIKKMVEKEKKKGK